MGYDMYIQDSALDHDVAYFRLNIWGMGVARELMYARGMLCDPPRGPWPAKPDGMDWDAYEWVKYPDERIPGVSEPSAEQCTVAKQYQAELDAYLAGHSGECPGIPIWKFGSNDGWRVVPAEIDAALRALAGSSQSKPEATWWDDWIAWLRLAAQHGGFEVY